MAEFAFSSLSAQQTMFDVRVNVWTQENGRDFAGAAADFVVVPAVFAVAAYDKRDIRVGIRNNDAPRDTERAYRIAVREVVPGTATPPPTARVYILPLFVAPQKLSGAAAYELQKAGDGADLIVRNTSNRHVFIGNLTVLAGEDRLYDGTLNDYILAGNTRTIHLKLDAPLKPGEAKLEFSDESHEQHTATAAIH